MTDGGVDLQLQPAFKSPVSNVTFQLISHSLNDHYSTPGDRASKEISGFQIPMKIPLENSIGI